MNFFYFENSKKNFNEILNNSFSNFSKFSVIQKTMDYAINNKSYQKNTIDFDYDNEIIKTTEAAVLFKLNGTKLNEFYIVSG